MGLLVLPFLWLIVVQEQPEEGEDQKTHGGQEGPSLAPIVHPHAETVTEGRRDQKKGQPFQEIGRGGRVLKGMGGVRVEIAAPVCSQLFDGDLGSHRPHGQGWPRFGRVRWLKRRHRDRRSKCLDNPLGHQRQTKDQ
jgi:hypothetical protein